MLQRNLAKGKILIKYPVIFKKIIDEILCGFFKFDQINAGFYFNFFIDQIPGRDHHYPRQSSLSSSFHVIFAHQVQVPHSCE